VQAQLHERRADSQNCRRRLADIRRNGFLRRRHPRSVDHRTALSIAVCRGASALNSERLVDPISHAASPRTPAFRATGVPDDRSSSLGWRERMGLHNTSVDQLRVVILNEVKYLLLQLFSSCHSRRESAVKFLPLLSFCHSLGESAVQSHSEKLGKPLNQPGTYVNRITSPTMRSLPTSRSRGRAPAKKDLPCPSTTGWR
jgi:hypothetical protein